MHTWLHARRYTAFVFVSWVPLRDTAALAVMHVAPRKVLMLRALQLGTPLLLAALSTLSFIESSSEDADGGDPRIGEHVLTRAWARLSVDLVAKFVVYLLLPLVPCKGSQS